LVCYTQSNDTNNTCDNRLEYSTTPQGFCPKVWATGLRTPRAIYSLLDNEVLVVEVGASCITVLYDDNGDGYSDPSERVTIATQSGLNHAIEYFNGSLYASSPTTVYRWAYTPGDRSNLGVAAQVIINIPAVSDHLTRVVRFSSTGVMFVQCGSSSNVDTSAVYSQIRKFMFTEPLTAPIDWSTGQIVYAGLRNEVGLRFDKLERLWGVENGCDDLQRSDIGGDITETNPAEEVNIFEQDGFYGYPYCWSEGVLATQYAVSPGTQFYHPDFPQYNDTWCRENVIPPAFALRAHTAPLDIVFNYYTSFSSSYEGGAFITEHGSWNRVIPKGYQVIFLPIDPVTHNPIGPETPFLYYNSSGSEVWPSGWRPVGLAWKKCDYGECLYISSDTAGNIIEMSYHGPNSTTESTYSSDSSLPLISLFSLILLALI